MEEEVNKLTKKELVKELIEYRKAYTNIVKDKLDLDMFFKSVTEAVKTYIDNPMLRKDRTLPLPYRIVTNEKFTKFIDTL
jgi:hypothetical protein